MGKKRHSLGSKVRPKKNKKKKKSKKWKKNFFIETDKVELGIEELCKQLPEVCLDPGSSSAFSSATQRFLQTCNISESATDPVYDRKKKKKERIHKKRLQLAKKKSESLKQLFSTVSYEDQLPKKEEKNLCQLLDNLSCKPVSLKPGPAETAEVSRSPKPGFIYTDQDARSFHKKLKTPRRRSSSDSD